MKKMVGLLLIFAMLFTFAACENTPQTSYVEDEPTEEELEGLFTDAMHEINSLATDDPVGNLQRIFDNIEIFWDDVSTVKQIPYVKTSLPYNDLVDYYGKIFTDEELDWVLSRKYMDCDGVVYCSLLGGMTGSGIRFVSAEKITDNTYKATYVRIEINQEEKEQYTTFSVKKTDAGYRISGIDYHPSVLD